MSKHYYYFFFDIETAKIITSDSIFSIYLYRIREAFYRDIHTHLSIPKEPFKQYQQRCLWQS